MMLCIRRVAAASACVVSVLGGPAVAQTIELGLAKASNCLSCHQVDRKVVGPAFAAIADRFEGNPDAADYLATSIIGGSAGRWGPVPMPRQTHVSNTDAQALARWILSLASQNKDAEIQKEETDTVGHALTGLDP